MPTPKLARNEARSALIEGALVQLATLGPVRVHPNEICAELGVSKALVNYHFGGREGLLLEAMALGYERYVDHLEAAAAAGGPDPFERLLAWIEAQVRWTRENAGLAVALNFPDFFSGPPSDAARGALERMTAAGARNFSNLRSLVVQARRELSTSRDGRSASEDADLLDAALIGWTTLGMSVWGAGEHLPTRLIEGRQLLIPLAQDRLRSMLRQLLSR